MWTVSGRLQHYDWGSLTALPDFLGEEPDGTPWAEVWFGAHPVAPSLLDSGLSLEAAIAAEPRRMLGEGVERAFAWQLPYLLKEIAPERPLSLQVHPSREHAEESFAAENAVGLALDSPLRNYRDPHHKPEMLVALTRFTALCGFRSPRRTANRPVKPPGAAGKPRAPLSGISSRRHSVRSFPPAAADAAPAPTR